MRDTISPAAVTWSHLLAMTCALATTSATLAVTPSPSWPQWGGLNGDFAVAAPKLADTWPAEGPKKLWSQPLGEGYSPIVADQGRLYTMFRQGQDEVVVALRADTGQPIWEHRYVAKTYPSQTAQYGDGPNASPLIMAGRLITIGHTGLMNCLDVATGKPIWSHDLVKDFKGAVQYYGYSNSPIAYKDTIITLVGGKKRGVIALDPANGKTVWKSKPFGVSYA